jgi:cobalt-zinc-cadmium efflux system outer membrane protein
LRVLFIALAALAADHAAAADERASAPPSPPAAPAVPRILGLADALALAAAGAPSIAVAEAGLVAAERRAAVAGRRANPALDLEAEDFGGGLADRAAWTLALTQAFDLGGDRAARARLAVEDAGRARGERAAAALDAAERVTGDFLAAWVAQERLWVLREAGAVSREAVEAAAQRWRAGAAPEVERLRAEGRLARTEAELSEAEAVHAAARRVLAGAWGAAEAAFDSLALPEPEAAPAHPPGPAPLDAHPGRRIAEAEVRAAEARLRLARAARVPDLEGRVGVRRLDEDDATGFVAGLSLPLPLWDSGGGEVAAAIAERDRAEIAAHEVERSLASALASATGRLSAALATYRTLVGRAAPAAAGALATLRAGYRAGRFGYLDLIEAEREALEVKLAAVDARAAAWAARAALDRLTGGEGRP